MLDRQYHVSEYSRSNNRNDLTTIPLVERFGHSNIGASKLLLKRKSITSGFHSVKKKEKKLFRECFHQNLRVMSLRIPDRFGVSFNDGTFESTALFLPPPLISLLKVGSVGQANSGIERLFEDGESAQRLGSVVSLLGGCGVHDLYSPSNETSGDGVIHEGPLFDVDTSGRLLERESMLSSKE